MSINYFAILIDTCQLELKVHIVYFLISDYTQIWVQMTTFYMLLPFCTNILV